MNHPTTIAQIIAILRKLTEGDRLRVLKFAQGIASDRAGKRAKRRARLPPRSAIDDWRVGQ